MSKEVEIKSKFNALYIDPTTLRKIQYWTDAADGEVSGLGIIEQEDGRMIVKEAYILEQECTSAETELDPEAISKLMTDIIKAGKDPGKLKFWWHSHVNMSVFWSGTDDTCAETLSTEYAFSLVVNKDKDRRARLDLYNPFRITVDHIKLIELSEEDADLKKRCEDDVKEKVKGRTYHYNGCHGRDHRGSGRGYFGGNQRGIYGDYDFPYDEFDRKGSPDRPGNWGKRVKLSLDDLDDIDRLSDIVKQLAYTPDALNDYVKETMQVVMKEVYNEKAKCQDGPGIYWKENKVCERCDIESICKTLSEKFGDDMYEGENITEVGDIALSDEGKTEAEDIEIVVDSDKKGGE